MAATDLYLGRGIVTLGGQDLGQVSDLTVRHEYEAVPRRVFDDTSGGVSHVARRVASVRVEFTVHEYQLASLVKLLRVDDYPLELAQTTYALAYSGCNKYNSAVTATLSIPVVALQVPFDLPVLAEQAGSLSVIGDVLRDPTGSPQWYDFQFSGDSAVLSANSATHAHSTDAFALAQNHVAAVISATHAHAADATTVI